MPATSVFNNWVPGAGSFSGFGSGGSSGPATVTVSPPTASGVVGSTQSFTASSSDGGTNFRWDDGGAGGSFSVQNAATTVYTIGAAGAVTITATEQGSAGTAVETGSFPAPTTNYLAARNSPTYTAPGSAFSNGGGGPGPTWTGGGFADPNSGTLASQIAWTQQAGGILSGNMLYSGTLDSAYTLVNGTKYVFSVRVKSSTAFSFYVFLGAGTYNTTIGTAGFNGHALLSHPGDGQWHTLGFIFTAGASDASAGNFNLGSMYNNATADVLIPTHNSTYFDWEFGPAP